MQKKFWLLLLVTIILSGLAVLNAGSTCGATSCKFTDSNKDGICDLCKVCKEADCKDGCKSECKDKSAGKCKEAKCEFVDKNKDGLCDTCKECKEADCKAGCKPECKTKCESSKAGCAEPKKTGSHCGSTGGCSK